jgi:hypothetical protein
LNSSRRKVKYNDIESETCCPQDQLPRARLDSLNGRTRLEHRLLSPLLEDQLSLSDTVSEFSGGLTMVPIIAMSSVWAVITIAFVVLVLYRRSLTKQESDWIPLTDDAKEDSAIQAQTVIEMKTRKLTVPIRTLGTLSLLMLLVIVGFWLFHSLFTPPPMPQ